MSAIEESFAAAAKKADRFEEIYAMAAECTGNSVGQLKKMAYQVFATMLHHAMLKPDTPNWTVAVVGAKRLEVEVNFTPRNLEALEVPSVLKDGRPVEFGQKRRYLG